MVNTGPVRVGWIGTGVMGSPMCEHLLDAGYPVKVFGRTEERAIVCELVTVAEHPS